MKGVVVFALGLLGGKGIGALDEVNRELGSTSSSGSGVVDDGDTVGSSATAVYLPTELLQSQLLNATGMEPDSLVAVASSYSVLQDGSPGLADIAAPNTNAFTSVLIVPAIASNNSDANITSILEQPNTNSTDDLSGRTQLMYNCTSAANLWNLLEDPNVVMLEDIELFGIDTSEDDSGSDGLTWADAGVDTSATGNTTEMPREIVAVALIKVANCSDILSASSERAVLGNLFFGAGFINSSTYFYVLNSSIQDLVDVTSSPKSCFLRLEMARASLIEVYPNCKIKFQSTDLNNLITSDTTTATSSEDTPPTTRRLASSFGFVKDPSCTYACGKSGAPVDQCLASNGKGGWIKLQCTMEFYQRAVGCGYECGDETGSPYNQAEPAANQCYDCYKTTSACKSGYYSVSGVGCCQKLTCPAVPDTSMLSPSLLTWNLEADGRTITNSAFPIYNNGRCSDTSSPTTSCCLITCTNCYTSIAIASLYVDLDTYPDTKKYSTTSEMQLTGTSEMKLKIFAPNGCVVENTETVVSFTRTTSLGSGIDLELRFALDIQKKLNALSHRSNIEFGSTNTIQSFSAGTVHSSQNFAKMEVTSKTSQDLAPTGVDIDVEVGVIPTVTGCINLLTKIAKIAVKTRFTLFTQLQAHNKFPDPYAKLTSKYLNEASMFRGGDCRVPHFMEYYGYAGYANLAVTLPTSLDVKDIVTRDYEPVVLASTDRVSTSLMSGCIAAAYSVQVGLFMTLDEATMMTDKKQTALKNILTWALGVPEIDPTFVTITSVSIYTGEVVIQMSVPPSVSAVNTTAPQLVTQLYQTARTNSFAATVSSYVGLSFASRCDSGWSGTSCASVCSSSHCSLNSADCNSLTGDVLSCSSCDTSWWGSLCRYQCSFAHCPLGSATCNIVTGSVISCNNCETGWWGIRCEKQCSSSHCPVGSVRCDAASGVPSSCSSCDNGWWGTTCQNQCSSPHCPTGSVSCDSVSGEAILCSACNSGWWGATCQNQCYSPHCTIGSVSCNAGSGAVTSCSSCDDGWWGSACATQCSSPHCPPGTTSCVAATGYTISCSSCDDTWWGNMCENRCVSTHCPTGSAHCDAKNGKVNSCDYCDDGWWGTTCGTRCSSLHCPVGSVRCDVLDGTVDSCSACNDGWWGTYCQTQCSSDHCPVGSVSCDATTGSATSCKRCEDGWWGEICQNECALGHCIEGSIVCNAVSGAAISCDRCEAGWWGTTCSKKCTSEHCADGSVHCESDSGDTKWCDACEDGWWGPMCKNQCTLTHCPTGSVSCDAASGTATSCSQCDDGWWGVRCQTQCSSDSCPVGSVSCDHASGAVNSCDQCNDGYWGAKCENEIDIPAHCIGAQSPQKDGDPFECLACEHGYWGSRCEHSCDVPLRCRTSRCAQESGEVTMCLSCNYGWQGRFCRSKLGRAWP